MYVTAKPFKTVNRKFNIGDPVTAADLQDGPLSLQDWMARGVVVAAPPQPPPPESSAEV